MSSQKKVPGSSLRSRLMSPNALHCNALGWWQGWARFHLGQRQSKSLNSNSMCSLACKSELSLMKSNDFRWNSLLKICLFTDWCANCVTFKRQQAKCCQTLFSNQWSFETSSALLQTAAYLYWAFQRLFKQYFPKFNDNILTFQNPSIKFGWSPFLSINCICIKYVYSLWWGKKALPVSVKK